MKITDNGHDAVLYHRSLKTKWVGVLTLDRYAIVMGL